MTERQLRTAVEAYQAIRDTEAPQGVSSFVCPYPNCRAFAAHTWGKVVSLNVPATGQRGWTNRSISFAAQDLWLAQCSVCHNEVMFYDGQVVWPVESQAPAPNRDMPEDVAADFEEARQIYMQSPRGAAALLRLGLQKLCGHLGAPGDINQAIGKLVAEGRVSQVIQQALDSLRVIGNEAVHPGTLDLKDDQATALRLFKLLNFVVEKTISEAKHIAEIYGNLPPAKLKGIEDRDKKSQQPEQTPAQEQG